jgi:hypothetical protein
MTDTVQQLDLVSEKTLYGYNVFMVDSGNLESTLIAESLSHDPVAALTKNLSNGYWFRAPNITHYQLSCALDSLEYVQTEHDLTVYQQNGSLVVHARFCDRSDAAMFAFNQLEVFQKWSGAQQQELDQQQHDIAQPIEVDRDGIARGVKVTVVTLED